jgi:hypothetical protein
MDAIGGLLRSIGDGFVGLVAGTFDAIGGAIRGAVGAAHSVLPGLWLPIVVFVVLVALMWTFAKR